MTTDQELLARIDERIALYKLRLRQSCSDEEFDEWVLTLSAWKALRAVVEREEKDAPPLVLGEGRWDWLYQDGYNQALADIKADIKKELG